MKMAKHPLIPSLLAAAVLAACGGSGDHNTNTAPDFLGAVRATSYDGASDDLLTAGLGASGLAAAAPQGAAALRIALLTPMPWRPPPPNCAAPPSTPTTAPCWI